MSHEAPGARRPTRGSSRTGGGGRSGGAGGGRGGRSGGGGRRSGGGGKGGKGGPKSFGGPAPAGIKRPPDVEEGSIPIEECEFGKLFELRPELLKGLAACGYRDPSPIQAQAIPHALAGRDVIGQARTGTGKTCAFLVPALQKLSDRPGPRVLVVVPTRELAVQVATEAWRIGRFLETRPCAVYGGAPMPRQVEEIEGGAKVIAATPGRLLDHLSRRTFTLKDLDMLILDEADRMFDLGFRDDIAKIMSQAGGRRQTMLFSATLSDEVLGISAKYMNNPAEVFLAPDKMTVEEVHQTCFLVPRERKTELLLAILQKDAPEKSIVFTRTKAGADRLAEKLQKKGLKANEIHSDLPQGKREKILQGFRDGSFQFLIATDVAARGLDIDDVSHVINFDVPENAEDYVHRVGRTARMGKEGRAATFVTPDDGPFLTSIEKLINQQVPVESTEDYGVEVDTAKKERPKAKGPSYTRTLMGGYVRKKPRRP